jgi:hypothetical protein
MKGRQEREGGKRGEEVGVPRDLYRMVGYEKGAGATLMGTLHRLATRNRMWEAIFVVVMHVFCRIWL